MRSKKKGKDKGGAGPEIGREGGERLGKGEGGRTTRESTAKDKRRGRKEEEAGLKGGKGRAKESEEREESPAPIKAAALDWPVVAARGIPGYPP